MESLCSRIDTVWENGNKMGRPWMKEWNYEVKSLVKIDSLENGNKMGRSWMKK